MYMFMFVFINAWINLYIMNVRGMFVRMVVYLDGFFIFKYI
jgi:hypothetical protein